MGQDGEEPRVVLVLGTLPFFFLFFYPVGANL